MYNILNVRTRQLGTNHCMLTAVVPQRSISHKSNVFGDQSRHHKGKPLYSKTCGASDIANKDEVLNTSLGRLGTTGWL